MPKLYDYFGVVVNGIVQQISYSPMAGRAPLPAAQQRYFEELVLVQHPFCNFPEH
jgi:hypothetical protein